MCMCTCTHIHTHAHTLTGFTKWSPNSGLFSTDVLSLLAWHGGPEHCGSRPYGSNPGSGYYIRRNKSEVLLFSPHSLRNGHLFLQKRKKKKVSWNFLPPSKGTVRKETGSILGKAPNTVFRILTPSALQNHTLWKPSLHCMCPYCIISCSSKSNKEELKMPFYSEKILCPCFSP